MYETVLNIERQNNPTFKLEMSLLLNQTLEISSLINSNEYICLTDFTEIEIQFIKEINKQRNMLHFPTQIYSPISNEIILRHINLRDKLIKGLIAINSEFGKKIRICSKAFLENRLKTLSLI